MIENRIINLVMLVSTAVSVVIVGIYTTPLLTGISGLALGFMLQRTYDEWND